MTDDTTTTDPAARPIYEDHRNLPEPPEECIQPASGRTPSPLGCKPHFHIALGRSAVIVDDANQVHA
jgi:hypothetical protein